MEIKRIWNFRTAHDLFLAETNFLTYEKDKSFIDFIINYDDFEDKEYFCINDEQVVVADGCTGNVLFIDSLERFYQSFKDAWSN